MLEQLFSICGALATLGWLLLIRPATPAHRAPGRRVGIPLVIALVYVVPHRAALRQRRGRVRLARRRHAAVREPAPAARRLGPLPGVRPLHRRLGGARLAAPPRRPPARRALPAPDFHARPHRAARLSGAAAPGAPAPPTSPTPRCGTRIGTIVRHAGSRATGSWPAPPSASSRCLLCCRCVAPFDTAAGHRHQSVDQADEVRDLDRDLPGDDRLVHARAAVPSPAPRDLDLRWTIFATMLIEIVCIVGQAARGTTSHFNQSSVARRRRSSR